MSVVASLNSQKQGFDSGNDTMVVPRVFETVIGGRTLDTTNFTPTIIPAGHVVIKEDATGNHKPMPISGGVYAVLPTVNRQQKVDINF